MSKIKRGRKPLPKALKRSYTVNVKLNNLERDLVVARARAAGMTVAEYVRSRAIH